MKSAKHRLSGQMGQIKVVASYLFKCLQKITITDLALLLQHLLTCKKKILVFKFFFKAGRALHEARQRNCKVIDIDNFINL